MSLRFKQYYADNRNQFWRVLFPVFGAKPEQDYQMKVAFLRGHRIALWDVLKYCTRVGSADDTIHDEIPNEFSAFFDDHPGIRYVIFNGGPPREKFDEFVDLNEEQESRLKMVTMPSTSARNIAPNESKISQWRVISGCINGS